MDYLFFGARTVHIYTDHRNLLFVFAPLTLEPTLGRHIISKVQRWALFLSRFSYVIEHVDGDANVFADMLTRWARCYRRDNKSLRTVASLSILSDDQIMPSPEELVWPTLDEMRAAQVRASEKKAGLHFDEEERIWKRDGKFWIPRTALELQLKIIVISHAGSLGHRGQDATKSIVRENFWWASLDNDVDQLVRRCLHCIVSRSGKLISRPLSHALHAERPNEVVHMDFLYMGPGVDGKNTFLSSATTFRLMFGCGQQKVQRARRQRTR